MKEDLPESKQVSQDFNAGYLRSKMPGNRREKSNFLAMLIFGANIFAYLLTFWTIIFAPFWLVKIIAIGLNGLFIGTLFVIGHDACHQSFTSSKFLNHLLGRIVFLPSLTTFSAWEVAHNQLHHGWTNFKQNDVFVPLSKREFDALPRWRRNVERFYRTIIGIAFYYQIEVWWKHLIAPRQSDFEKMNRRVFRFDILLIIGFLIFQLITLFVAVPYLMAQFNLTAPIFPLLILTNLLVPYAVWAWLYAFVTLQHHTHPNVPWFDKRAEWNFFNSQVQASVHVVLPRVIEILFLNVLEHTAHHVDSKIPLYKLRESQKVLEKEFPEQITVHASSLSQFHNTMKICKLYDYDDHCWTDFDGNVTAKIEIN